MLTPRIHLRWLQLAALAAAVATAAALVAPSAQAGRPRPRRLVLTAPANAAGMVGTSVEVRYTVPSGIADADHVHFQLDGGPVHEEPTPLDGVYTLAGITPGPHVLEGTVARADHSTIESSAAVAVHFYTAAGSSDPGLVGQWAAPIPLPTVAVDLILLYTGKLLFWAGEFASAPNFGELWDPATNAITPVPNPFSNIFCSSHVALADGRILVAGGHDIQNGILGLAKASTFDPATERWTSLPSMAYRRWYPTLTALPDGRAIVNSGSSTSETVFVDTPEIYDPIRNTWTQLTGSRLSVEQYPMMFLLPDGRLLQAGSTEYPTATRVLDFGTGAWMTVDPRVLDGGSAAMYAPGRILKAGSASIDGTTPSASSAASSYVLDMTAPAPAWRETAPMAYGRTFHDLTLLPDGTVLATGGSAHKSEIDLAQGVLAAELWSPQSETWSTLGAMQYPRLYHGTAVLLPDGRVAVSGGGNIPAGTDMTSVEVFSPPYLFRGPRPVIEAAPTLVRYGTGFQVYTPDAARIATVSLLRPGAATHAFDQDQRLVPLPITQVMPDRLDVSAPADPNLAPPGYYMLFLVDTAGVPSVARFLRLPAPYEDAEPPTQPSGLSASPAPGRVGLSWNAASDAGGAVSYHVHRSAAPGTPPSPANEIATSAATSYLDSGLAPGTYHYVVVASDPTGNRSAPSAGAAATVPADTTAPLVALTAPAAGVLVQGVVALLADASDDAGVVGVQFTLDAAPLGPEDTSPPYAYTWNSAGTPEGSHVLGAVARDAAGNVQASTPIAVVVESPLVPGLVAAWDFEEGQGSTTADTSGNGHLGALSGATWTPSGRSGGALAFDGVDDRVTVADADALDFSTGFTLEAWVRPELASGWRNVLMKETASGLAYALYSDTPDARAAGYIAPGGAQVEGTAALPRDVWTHLALTYDGSALRLYQNGVLAGTAAANGAIAASTGPLRIGGNAIWGESFQGRIDEVRLYGRALTASELLLTMESAAPRLAITTPGEGAIVAGPNVAVSYGVEDSSSEVDHVHFRLDGGPDLEEALPLDGAHVLVATAGAHTLEGFLVRADHSRIAGSDAPTVSFTVSSAPDTQAPTVVLTAPRAGDTVQGVVTVSASASDDTGVVGVRFFLDGIALGPEDPTAPYSMAWDTTGATGGGHVLTAVARDAADQTATSIPVAVVVPGQQQVAGLVAAYGFDEEAGASTADLSGHGNTGTVSGATWTPDGHTGAALSFDGSADQVLVPDAASLDLDGAMTIEAWVAPSEASGWRNVLMKEAAGDLAWALYANTPSAGAAAYVATPGIGTAEAPGALTLDAWTHLAATYDGIALRLYQNGAQVAAQALSGGITVSSGPLRIGGNAIWGEWFRGRIDEVRIYNRALAPAEIVADRDRPVAPPASPTRSSPIVVDAAARRVWVVAPDNDSVTALGADSLAVEREVPVGRHPTGLALDAQGQLWVTCPDDDTVWVLDAQDGAVRQTLTLPWGSAPIAIAFAPDGTDGFIAAYGSGRIFRVDATTRTLGTSLAVGPTPRALAVSSDGARLLVTRFLSSGSGSVASVDLQSFSPQSAITMPLDTTSQDGSLASRGLPNYLAGIAIDPAGGAAWVAAQKVNVLRGLARDGQPMTFETTVRALVGVLDLALGQEAVARRIDLDNLSQPSAVAFGAAGDRVLVTVQGSNRLLALDALGAEVARAETGRAPRGIAVDPVTQRIFTHDFMSRTVSVFDGSALAGAPGQLPRIAQVDVVSVEALAPDVLLGKQLFYDASDPRMSRDGYLSCASCHVDGGHDGQVWDFTDRGEGLRNTIDLRGQGGAAGAPLHWSGNFDEVQDFEGDMRLFFGGTGFLADTLYFAGDRAQPLGAPKAGLSPELDALAAYVDSLVETPRSPARPPDGASSPEAVAGAAVFASLGCNACHLGPRLSDSPSGVRHDVGTLKPTSGSRLGLPLDGLDTPMLSGLAGTAPYLHDGSAATVRDVLTTANPTGAHGAVGLLTPEQIDDLVQYLLELELAP